jgi:hypothetical protein
MDFLIRICHRRVYKMLMPMHILRRKICVSQPDRRSWNILRRVGIFLSGCHSLKRRISVAHMRADGGLRQSWGLRPDGALTASCERMRVRNPLKLFVTGFTFVLLILFTGSAFAERNDQAEVPAEGTVFVPPDIGAPSERLGAGTREIEGATKAIVLLVPEGGGLTTSGTPPLVWYLSNGFRGKVTTQISAPGASGVVLERNGPVPKGYYNLDLRRSDFRLKEGVIYVWKVVLTEDDLVVGVAESLVERVGATDEDPGQAGIWFDALAPLVYLDLSGRVRVADQLALTQLLKAGGVIE